MVHGPPLQMTLPVQDPSLQMTVQDPSQVMLPVHEVLTQLTLQLPVPQTMWPVQLPELQLIEQLLAWLQSMLPLQTPLLGQGIWQSHPAGHAQFCLQSSWQTPPAQLLAHTAGQPVDVSI